MTAGAASHSLCDLGRVYFPLWACFLKAKTPLSGNSSQQVAGSFHFPGPQRMPPAPPPGLAIVHNDGRGGGVGSLGTPDGSLGNKHHAGPLWRGPCALPSPIPVPLSSTLPPVETRSGRPLTPTTVPEPGIRLGRRASQTPSHPPVRQASGPAPFPTSGEWPLVPAGWGLLGGEEEKRQRDEDAGGEAQSFCPVWVGRRVSPGPGLQGRTSGWEGAQALGTDVPTGASHSAGVMS